MSWFAAGCYYYLIQKYEHARRFFAKATQLDVRATDGHSKMFPILVDGTVACKTPAMMVAWS